MFDNSQYKSIAELSLDAQSRIRIPDQVIRELGLESRIMFIGRGDYFNLEKP